MGSLRSFLLCLSPALIANLAILLAGERLFGFAIILIVAGSGIAASCVVSCLHRAMEPKGRVSTAKVILMIFAFPGTLTGYLAIAGAGCCYWASTARF